MKTKTPNRLIPTITVVATFLFLFLVFKTRANTLFSYHEGWCTFYYDSHYICDNLTSYDGICKLAKGFVLQFFAHPWHGALLYSCFFSLIAFIAVNIAAIHLKSTIKKITAGAACFILSITLALFTIGSICQINLMSVIYTRNASQIVNMQYMTANHYSKMGDWDRVIDVCKKYRPVTFLPLQNCLNMALAEKGELGEKLMEEPCQDISSVFTNQIPNEYIAGLLSDVYYSMGHIAQSQRYAFEANEKLDNLSPRMLQRLVQTNIIYGQYRVAEKYLYWLERTIYYKEWCKEQRQLIKNHSLLNKNKEYAEKRRCLIKDNRFSGIHGLDDDLRQIASATRGTHQCKTTLQFLGALYILAGYATEFKEMVSQYKEELGEPLPKFFDAYNNHISNKESK